MTYIVSSGALNSTPTNMYWTREAYDVIGIPGVLTVQFLATDRLPVHVIDHTRQLVKHNAAL